MKHKLHLSLILLFVFLMLSSPSFGQGLPDPGKKHAAPEAILPDPGGFLDGEGELFEADYLYNDVLYDTYLYPEAKDSSFSSNYFFAALQAGFTPELTSVEEYKAIKIFSHEKKGEPALLLYDYQGYVLLMVPKNMNFSLNAEQAREKQTPKVFVSEPTPTPKSVSPRFKIPTHTPAPTKPPVPTATKVRLASPTKTPTPDPYAGYEKYRVKDAGTYGFQIRPYPNTDWFYLQDYQHPVYDGDIVYFTGTSQVGPGYGRADIRWFSVITDDGFTGWLPAYILEEVR